MKKAGYPEEEIKKTLFEEYAYASIDLSDRKLELETQAMLFEARYWGVPVPTYRSNSQWENRHQLSDEGMANLRKQIRDEKHERRRSTIELATVLTGIIGALTGLLAIIYD